MGGGLHFLSDNHSMDRKKAFIHLLHLKFFNRKILVSKGMVLNFCCHIAQIPFDLCDCGGY